MTDAERLRKAADALEYEGIDEHVPEVRRIADRLEKIDAPKPTDIYPSPPPGWPWVKDETP